jgi:hypothetical protein
LKAFEGAMAHEELASYHFTPNLTLALLMQLSFGTRRP